MRGAHPGEQVGEDTQGFGLGQATGRRGVDVLREAAAGEIGHHHGGQLACVQDPLHRHDVGMLQSRLGTSLLQEAGAGVWDQRILLLEDLDRHGHVQTKVQALVDSSHAPFAQLGVDPKLSNDDVSDLEVGHSDLLERIGRDQGPRLRCPRVQRP